MFLVVLVVVTVGAPVVFMVAVKLKIRRDRQARIDDNEGRSDDFPYKWWRRRQTRTTTELRFWRFDRHPQHRRRALRHGVRCDQDGVVAAERGRAFTRQLGGTWVRWSYTFTPAESGATLSEAWEFLPDGIARFHEKYVADAEAQIAERIEAALRGIAVTPAAIKAVAEAK
jgi:hypothetical protein